MVVVDAAVVVHDIRLRTHVVAVGVDAAVFNAPRRRMPYDRNAAQINAAQQRGARPSGAPQCRAERPSNAEQRAQSNATQQSTTQRNATRN
eukprot:11160548-Lingulodinium_polyedra.AAC.1